MRYLRQFLRHRGGHARLWAGLLVLTPVLVIPPATAVAAQAPPHAADSRDDARGVDDLGQVVDVGAVVGRVKAAFEERYGGAWVDSTGIASLLVVGVVGPSSADDSLVKTVAGPLGSNRVRVTPVRLPASELARGRERVAAVLDAAGASYAIAVDLPSQKVSVEADRLDAPVIDAVRAAVPTDVLDLFVDPTLAFEATHQSRADYPPYESGLNIGAPHRCTSGFVVLASGPHGTTAGHCGQQGDPVRIGGRRVGNIDDDTLPKRRIGVNADAARFDIPASARTARIYVGRGRHRVVTGGFPDAELILGTRVCFQGITSGGGNCGVITRADMRIHIGRPYPFTLRRAWCANVGSRPGDSGGPVYQPLPDGGARAAGLLSAGRANLTCFSSIEQVLRELQATLFTG